MRIVGLFFFLPPEILAWLQMHSGTGHRQTHQLTQDLDLPFPLLWEESQGQVELCLLMIAH